MSECVPIPDTGQTLDRRRKQLANIEAACASVTLSVAAWIQTQNTDCQGLVVAFVKNAFES